MAAYRLMKAGVAVTWATEGFTSLGKSYTAGTLLIPAAARVKALPIFEALGVKAEGIKAKPAPKMLSLKTPRVGLYQSYVASMDEGWTRFIFDKSLNLDYATLHDIDVRGGNLRAKFDSIILPDSTARQMVEGHEKGEMADEFVGGLGAEGVAALKAFAEAGGTLIAFNNATELLTQMGAPVKNVLSGLGSRRGGAGREALGPESAQFYCPGAILDAKVDQTHPLAAGLDARSMVWFEFSPAFEVTGGKSVLTYDSERQVRPGRGADGSGQGGAFRLPPAVPGAVLGYLHPHDERALAVLVRPSHKVVPRANPCAGGRRPDQTPAFGSDARPFNREHLYLAPGGRGQVR
jgi:hypothetical protein